jgi:tRNA nucleotidyltransferase (CCA-adding enzyme)
VTSAEESGSTLERDVLREFVATDPRLETVRSASGEEAVWLVGGSVRDLLCGRTPTDLDLVIVGDPRPLAERLDPDPVFHDEFMTATASLGEGSVDLARARVERYREPGALPRVEPASIEQDLARRDFTINAMAVPLDAPDQILDPFGGLEALVERRLSLIHEGSFGDDPTRALRGARYAARFGFEPDPAMVEALRTVDLETISRDRLIAEVRRFGKEEDPGGALAMACDWGLLDLPESLPAMVGRAIELVGEGPWQGITNSSDLIEAAVDAIDRVEAFPLEPPASRIEQRDLITRTAPEILVLARAGGREWLDWWPEVGSGIGLAIDGDDLIEAGVEPGPAVGTGLRAALADALEGAGTGRDRQMEIAIEAAAGDGDG